MTRFTFVKIILLITLFSFPLFSFPQGVLEMSKEADQYFNEMNYAMAESLYLKILQHEPLPPDLHSSTLFNLGLLYFYTNDMQKAQQYIRRAIEVDPGNMEIRQEEEKIRRTVELMRDASRQIQRNELDDAINTLTKVVADQPKLAEAWFMLSQVYIRKGDYELASEYLNKAIEMNPHEEKYAKGKTTMAAKLYKEGITEFKRRNYDGAFELFKNSVSIDPGFASSWYMMGVIKNRVQDYQAALEYYQKAIAADSTKPTPYFGLGNVYFRQGNNEQAIKYYKKATEVDPNYIKAWSQQGVIWFKEGQYKEALKVYKKVISINPSYPKAYKNMGRCYKELGDNEKAVEMFGKAVQIDPKDYVSYTLQAQVYNEMLKFDLAKEAANRALRIKPNYGGALIELGYAEKGLGNRSAAIAAFTRAKSDRKYAKLAQFELKKLQGH